MVIDQLNQLHELNKKVSSDKIMHRLKPQTKQTVSSLLDSSNTRTHTCKDKYLYLACRRQYILLTTTFEEVSLDFSDTQMLKQFRFICPTN